MVILVIMSYKLEHFSAYVLQISDTKIVREMQAQKNDIYLNRIK